MVQSLSDIDTQLAALGSMPENVRALIDRHGGHGLSLTEADKALEGLASAGGINAVSTTPVAREPAKPTTASASKPTTTSPASSRSSAAAEHKRASKPPPESRDPDRSMAESRTRHSSASRGPSSRAPAFAPEFAPGERKSSRPAPVPQDDSLDAETTIAAIATDFDISDHGGVLPKDFLNSESEHEGDGTVTNVMTNMAAALVPKRASSAPARASRGAQAAHEAQPYSEETYPEVSVGPAPKRDADGTVTSVFTSMTAAMVPKRAASSPALSRTPSAPAQQSQSASAIFDENDESELLLDDDIEELFDGEIELLE